MPGQGPRWFAGRVGPDRSLHIADPHGRRLRAARDDHPFGGACKLLRGYPTCQRAQLGAIVLILGIVLLIIGLILKIAILWTIGIILLIIGAALFLLGSTGRAVGGRRHYW